MPRSSADRPKKGRLAGQLAFPAWSLAGHFRNCSVEQDIAQMRGFLETAGERTDLGFYEALLLESLSAQLNAAPGEGEQTR